MTCRTEWFYIMSEENLKKFINLFNKTGFGIILTSSENQPHAAISKDIKLTKDNKLTISSWFCLTTLKNVRKNPRLSIAVWDESTDKGFQVLGFSEKINDIKMLDGIIPDDNGGELPNTEREIIMNVEYILEMKHSAHTDQPIK